MKAPDAALAERPALPRPPIWTSGRLLGQYATMVRNPIQAALDARTEVGPFVRFRMGPIPAYFIFEPDDVRRVLVDDAERYGKTTRGYDVLRLVLGDGLVTSEGEFWLRQRRIAQPAFCRNALRGFADTMVHASVDMAERWKTLARVDRPFDMAKAMNQLTLRIAGETLMSVDLTGEAREITDSMDVAMSGFHALTTSFVPFAEKWPTPKNLRIRKAIETMRSVVDQVIAERRQTKHQVGDLLGMMMAVTDPETGEGMTDEQLRDEVLTMLLAGHETTANGLAWTWYLLSRYPLVKAQLYAELDEVLGGRPPSIDDLPRLTYTAQVIKESLRLYPPVWMLARQARENTRLSGYAVEKGAYVFIPIHAIHKEPRLFPHPEAFNPDRFHSDEKTPDRFAYLPFSRGQRQCIGDRFADMEMILVLATLAQRYDVALCPGQNIVAEPSVTLRPKDGIRMTVRPRYPDHRPSEQSETNADAPVVRALRTCPVRGHSGQVEESHRCHRQDDS